MDSLTARPQILKQANLSLIRKTIKEKGTVTRAEIADLTKISSTTVRSLLFDMLQNGEIENDGYKESSGGRKAERYRLVPDRYHSAVYCITDHQVHSLLTNVCGQILETTRLEAEQDDFEAAITSHLEKLLSRQEIRSIGIGVPGIVEDGCFWKKDAGSNGMVRIPIGENLMQRFGLPVVLENDLNATAIGFANCYQKEFPCEASATLHMVYLHFTKNCVSAGLLEGGRLIRGCRQFAGELGLIPMEDGRPLDEWMKEASGEGAYTDLVIRILCWVCGILNPQYIVLGGPDFRANCTGPISDGLYAVLPKQMNVELLYSPDVWRDYYDGMAALTAGKMFEEITLVKE